MIDLRLSLCVAAALGMGAGCTSDASLRVDNRSDFKIVELHITPVSTSEWGPDYLHGDPLLPGEAIVLPVACGSVACGSVACGSYDALLVDHTGVDCQLMGIELCLDNASWIIHNENASWIIHNETCTSFIAARAAHEAGVATAPDATPAR
jgi:hypothetical protein